MKNTFGYLVLIFVSLMLLSVIGGINGIFNSIAQTWTTDQTAQLASELSKVIGFGGIVFVAVLGLALYNVSNKGGGGGGGRRQQDQQYMISDGSTPPTPAQQQKMLTADVDGDWYEIEPVNQRQLV